MTDIDVIDAAHDHEDSGDGPDLFEDRLVVIVRLIDTADDEEEERRRAVRKVLVLRLLNQLLEETTSKIAAQFERAERI